MKNTVPQPIQQEYREEKQSWVSGRKTNDKVMISMTCPFPGTQNTKEIWRNLKQGQSSNQKTLPDGWDRKAYRGAHQGKTNRINSKWNGFIRNVENHVKEIIVEELSESLKVDISSIGIDESFADCGIDAITGVHLVQVINRVLMIELETTSIYDYGSVKQLTEFILSKYKDKLTKASGQNIKVADVKNDALSIAQDKYCISLNANTVPDNIDMTDQAVESRVEEIIVEKLSESLRINIDLIGIDESFADYGIDAITEVSLVQVINQALMIELETTSIFDSSSVKQLTGYILSKYRDTIIHALGQNINQTNIINDSTSDNQEKLPVNSYSEPFLRRGILTETDTNEKRKLLVQSKKISKRSLG